MNARTYTRDDRRVRLTGNSTGEVVTVTIDAEMNIVWTSSLQVHATYTCCDNPTECPNDFVPDWVVALMAGNLRTGGNRKIATPSVGLRVRRSPAYYPLLR